MASPETLHINGEIEKFTAGVTYKPDGLRVEVITKKYEPKLRKGNPSGTSNHETDHGLTAVVRGTRVKKMTNIPDSKNGSLGSTELESFDPYAAGAAAVKKRTGVSYDLMVLNYKGYKIGDIAGEVTQIANDYKDHHNEVALELDEKHVMGHSDIKKTIDFVTEEKNKSETIMEYTANIKRQDGSEKKIKKEAQKDDYISIPKTDMKPDTWYPVAANDNKPESSQLNQPTRLAA